MVAPRMAALEAAMMVKSFPVIPSKTSLYMESVDTIHGQVGIKAHTW